MSSSNNEEINFLTRSPIPPKHRIVIDKQPFDVTSLASLIRAGNWRNPLSRVVFTREQANKIWRMNADVRGVTPTPLPPHPGADGMSSARRTNLAPDSPNITTAQLEQFVHDFAQTHEFQWMLPQILLISRKFMQTGDVERAQAQLRQINIGGPHRYVPEMVWNAFLMQMLHAYTSRRPEDRERVLKNMERRLTY